MFRQVVCLAALATLCHCGTPAVHRRRESVALSPSARIADVAVGARFVCALAERGGVFCWGQGGPSGFLSEPWQPHPVPALTDAIDIEAGPQRICARLRDGAVVCLRPPQPRDAQAICGIQWASEQLQEWQAERLHALAGAEGLLVSDDTVCGQSHSGWTCTTTNAHGESGDCDAGAAVAAFSESVIAVGPSFVCGADSSAITCWGRDEWLRGHAHGSCRNRSALRFAFSGAEELHATWSHVCAVRHAEVWCWGDLSGQVDALAMPDLVTRFQLPHRMDLPPASALAVAPGSTYAVVKRAGSSVVVSAVSSGTWEALELESPSGLSAGPCGTTCAVGGGRLWCWGQSVSGELARPSGGNPEVGEPPREITVRMPGAS